MSPNRLTVTVCELPNRAEDLEDAWVRLVAHVQREKSDLVLLPEMPFFPWLPASKHVDPARWQQAVEAHDAWLRRCHELGSRVVAGSRPVQTAEGRRRNQAYLLDNTEGYKPVHDKAYLPDEEGFWEATWYEAGPPSFSPVTWHGVRMGFLICSELWMLHHARNYGRAGVQLLLCPRVTPRETLDKWLVGGRAAAVVSGAYCLSSNAVSPRGARPDLGGMGWIVDPDGEVLATTSASQPFVTLALDLSAADEAKKTYPRYLQNPGEKES